MKKLLSIWDDPEKFLKKSSKKSGGFDFKNHNFPSFNSGPINPKYISLGFLGLFALWMLSGFYRIDEGDQAIVLRFGAFNRIATPGLNYHLPNPMEQVISEKVHLSRRMEIGYRSSPSNVRRVERSPTDEKMLILSGDANIVSLNLDVRWRIKSLQDYVLNVADPHDTLRTSSESAVREVIGKTPISYVLSNQKQQIATEISVLLQNILDTYKSGIEIETVELLKAEPPSEVIDAYRDVQTAMADKEKEINQAEAYRNDILPRARGDADRMIQEAEAYKVQIISKAEGDVARFLSILKQYNGNKQLMADRLYLDTMEEILKDANKVIVGDSALTHFPVNQFIKK